MVLKEFIRPRKFDILVTTYEGVKSNINCLSRIHWEMMVVDEAHKIKSNVTQNYLAVAYLKGSFKLLMTGTPLSNNLQELWCLLNFIMPEIFSDNALFDELE